MPNATLAAPAGVLVEGHAPARPKLDTGVDPRSALFFGGILLSGLAFVVYSLYVDVTRSGMGPTTWLPFALLGVALFIALAFEFVNGFHDTANAVATVIYTHSMPATAAVVWSGFFNFLGVLFSTGAVAYGITALLPVELILQVGSSTGFAMVFALVIGAIVWNLGTWYLGLPASSSHTLIGSIIGVGLANQLMATTGGPSGVDWAQAAKVGYSLLFSPLIGFVASALLLMALKLVARSPKLYQEPKGAEPPPLWIRSLLILTCTGVSFAHGSNDGQKGMGLIMLILIGVVPTAYALNRALPDSEILPFLKTSTSVTQMLDQKAGAAEGAGASAGARASGEPHAIVSTYLRTHQFQPDVMPALAQLSRNITRQLEQHRSLRLLPASSVQSVRNDMYLTAEAIRRFGKDPAVKLSAAEASLLNTYRANLDGATRFIPAWVKIAVALALGLGTMVGWKRIVVTVGEKIGKSHLTYAQGASAELVAATTIAAADMWGLPVSTTQVLSSGVAGTMAVGGSGLRASTVRNMLMAWVLTLPAAILLSGSLFLIFLKIF